MRRKRHYERSNSEAQKKQQSCCVSAEVLPSFFSPMFSSSGLSESLVSSTLATVVSPWAASRPLIGSSGCVLCCFPPCKRMEDCWTAVVFVSFKKKKPLSGAERHEQAARAAARGHHGESVLSHPSGESLKASPINHRRLPGRAGTMSNFRWW